MCDSVSIEAGMSLRYFSNKVASTSPTKAKVFVLLFKILKYDCIFSRYYKIL